MRRPSPTALLKRGANYFKAHPNELLRVVRSALGLRVGVPLAALRYFAAEFAHVDRAPQDVALEVLSPGLRVGMTVSVMGSALRVAMTIFVETLELSGEHARVTARIADLDLTFPEGSDSPFAAVIKSGALDLSQPGNMVAFMPKRPDMLVDGKGDRVVIDLMKVPGVLRNRRLRQLMAVVTPVLTVSAIEARDDHLDVQLSAKASGLGDAFAAAQSAS